MTTAKTWGPFNGRQLTTIIVALVAALLLPGAVWAVDTFSNVAIQDPVTGNKASVDPSHRVLVGDGSGNLTVDGSVFTQPAATRSPFWLNAISFADGGFTAQFAATTATIAVTGIRITNVTAAPMRLTMYEYSGSSCDTSGSSKFIGQWMVPASNTLVESHETPLVVKPLSAGTPWCFGTYADNGSGVGSGFYTTYTGYVVSGTFASASAASAASTAPPNAGAPPMRGQ